MNLYSWVHIHLNAPFFIDDPFAEVPGQLKDATGLFAALELSRIAAKPLEDIMSFWSVDTDLAHEGEAHVKFCDCIAFDLLI